MKKRQYEKPSMEGVELEQEQELLVGSPVSGQLNDLTDYENQTDPFGF